MKEERLGRRKEKIKIVRQGNMCNRTENMQQDRREGKAITTLYLITSKFQMSLCPCVSASSTNSLCTNRQIASPPSLLSDSALHCQQRHTLTGAYGPVLRTVKHSKDKQISKRIIST